MMEVILAYAPWLEMGFGFMAVCAVYEFFFDNDIKHEKKKDYSLEETF